VAATSARPYRAGKKGVEVAEQDSDREWEGQGSEASKARNVVSRAAAPAIVRRNNITDGEHCRHGADRQAGRPARTGKLETSPTAGRTNGGYE